jgi:hypothetical protein
VKDIDNIMDWRLDLSEGDPIDIHGLGAFSKRLERAIGQGGGPGHGWFRRPAPGH